MNYLSDDQNTSPNQPNPSESSPYPANSKFNYTIQPLSQYDHSQISIYLFELLCQLNEPVLYYFSNKNVILYNKAFEELCTRIIPKTTIQQTIQRIWEIEDIPLLVKSFQDIPEMCFKKLNNIKLSKHLKATIGIHVFNLSDNQPVVSIVFEKITDETDKTTEEKINPNQIIEIFFSNLSHEIRTPLNAILGFAELLNIKDLPDEQRINYLNIIKEKGRLVIQHLEDVMELTKLENQTIQLSITETHLPLLCNEIHKEYLQIIQHKKLPIDFFLNIGSSGENSTCYIDRGRLYQMIKNMIDTALILTPKGYIQWGYEIKDNRFINIYVKYTGKSLSPNQQKILLDPMRMKTDVTDTEIQKIGLKLALIKLTIRCMEGKFYIENGDQSNAFTISLPFRIKEPQPQTNYHKIIPRPNWKNRVIVIAEDDEVNYQFLETLLSDTQAQVIHVQNGKQAIEICQSLPKVDLILMDIKMPEMSGYEAIHKIRQQKGKEIAIIAQTAYSSPSDKAKCFEMGCDAYLIKPIDVELFFKVLSKFLSD